MSPCFAWIVTLTMAILAVLPAIGDAHPGRLNKEGCHHVRKDFIYKSGKIMKKGEYHCHRLLRGLPAILDGSEVLADRGDDQQDDEKDRKDAESP